MKKNGRPSSYTDEMANKICELMSVKGMTLREICRMDDMPDRATVYRWIEANESFRGRYARSREALIEFWADESIEIADDGTNDWVVRQRGKDSVVLADHEHISRSKLRVEQRRWLMSKMAPQKYGDSVNLSGSGDIKLKVEIVKLSKGD